MARIFISYRREDSETSAGRIADLLRECFGPEQVFMDVDTLAPGQDFVEAIERAVAACDVLIAVIGRDWLTIADGAGHRRLDDPRDFVRVEIATALARDVQVIPILVRRATMPREEDLPGPLASLARRQALEISDARFRQDSERLVATLEKVLGVVRKSSGPEPVRWRWRPALGTILTIAAVSLGLWLFLSVSFPESPLRVPETAVVVALCGALVLGAKAGWAQLRRRKRG